MKSYYSSLLQSFIDWTDEEILLGKKFLDWDEIIINWENIDLHWEDIFILLETKKKGGGSGGDIQKGDLKRYIEGNPWRQMRNDIGDEKSEKLIKVYCEKRGIDYQSIFEKKENIRIIVNDFIRSNGDIKIKIKI